MSTPDTRGSENESYYENTLNLFVKIPQLAPINYYIGGQQGTGCIQVVHANRKNNLTGSSNILDGVLCQSPFGKRLEVNIDTGRKSWDSDQSVNDLRIYPYPIAIELKLLFLDNEDLKEI